MNKENILFGMVGLLLGLIVGFMFANSVNQSAVTPAVAGGAMTQNANLPAGHPQIPAGQQADSMPEIQAAVEQAKKEPDSFDAQIKAAELYYGVERYDSAIEYLERANKLKPDDYVTLVNLANAYFDSGKYKEAEKWYTTALGKQADDVNVRTDLGLTFMFRESPDYDRAIQEFQRSLQINPNHSQTLQNLTVAYTKKGDAEKAKSTLAQLESVNPGNSALPKLREDIQKMGVK